MMILCTLFSQPVHTTPPAIDPKLVNAIIQVESGGDPLAHSNKGARGLMQIMPSTAKALGYHPIQMWHPDTNVEAGTKYLLLLKEECGGDTGCILRKYYCGNRHNRGVCYGYQHKVMRVYGTDHVEQRRTKRNRTEVWSNNDSEGSTLPRGYPFTTRPD